MKYSKRTRKFRTLAHRVLRRLANRGCGDGGWCECLLCRVMRVVRTEQFRNKPIHKSSCSSPDQDASHNTRMVHWRGGLIEFAQDCREDIAAEPWYGIKLWMYKDEKPWIFWLDYCGPPHLYLTRKAASARAKQLREQYGCRVKVVKVIEAPKEPSP